METRLGHRHVMIYRRTHNVTLIFHNMSVSSSSVQTAYRETGVSNRSNSENHLNHVDPYAPRLTYI